jgi:beta-barrel assembly-enhancing protease
MNDSAPSSAFALQVTQRPRRIRSFVALLTLAAFTSACVSTNLPPISSSGALFAPLPDEIDLWSDARLEEEKLLEEVELYDDAELEAYLDEVVGRLNPPTMAAQGQVSYRVRVVADPTLNAFAYPHGALYVHTGLLAELENEAQLATVLGHEMTHVEHRHMLRHRRSAHNKEIALTAVAIAAAVVVADQTYDAIDKGNWGRAAGLEIFSEVLLGLGLQLALVASVNGYGRELEREADQGGFAKLRAAGYDVAQAPRVYETLKGGQGDRGGLEVFFFGSHPNLSERVANAKVWLAANPQIAVPTTDEAAFSRRTYKVVRDNAGLNIKLGRFDLAHEALDRAAALEPNDPEIARLRAELDTARKAPPLKEK